MAIPGGQSGRLEWILCDFDDWLSEKKSPQPIALRKKKATKVVAFLGRLIEIIWIARYQGRRREARSRRG